MCDKNVCPHKAEEMCACRPVREKNEDVLALVEHVAVNMTDIRWELEYTDIDQPEKRRLCRVGTCRVCGGRLCHDMDASDQLAGDDFLAAIYRHLYQLHNAGGNHMANAEFRRRFVEMFHEQDRPFIREWLERPENGHVCRMYRRSVKTAPVEEPKKEVKIYTIVRTGIDADRGSFPNPQSEGSFLSLRRAKAELQKLIRAEKDELDDRYDSQEHGEDYWEACQKGYAAALFSRLEIVSSELRLTPQGETPEDFRPADYLEQCAECYDTYGKPCCKDEEGECVILEDAQDELCGIMAEESDAVQRILRMHQP